MSTPPSMPPSDGICTRSRPNDANTPDTLSDEMATSLKALLTSLDGLSTTGVRRSRAGKAARATTCDQPPQQQQQQQQPTTSDETDSNTQKPADNVFERVASMVGRSLQDEIRAPSPICEYEGVLDDQKYSLRVSVPVMMQSTLQDEAAATSRTTATIRSPHRPRRGRRPRPNDGSGTLMSSLNNREGPPIGSIRSSNLEDELLGAKTDTDDDDDDDDDEGATKAEDGTIDDDCSLTCALSNETSTLNSAIPNSGGDDSRSRFHSSLDTDATDGSRDHQQNPPTFVGDSCICEHDGWYTLSTLIDEEIAKTEKNNRKWYK